jgi:deoxyadenosine/deoxycytidine kinase
VYIQSAENGQKNESLSKNKSLKIYEDLFSNVKLSYKLFSVIQTIDKNNQSNKRTGVMNII